MDGMAWLTVRGAMSCHQLTAIGMASSVLVWFGSVRFGLVGFSQSVSRVIRARSLARGAVRW